MSVSDRSGNWKWWVCGLLLLATTINYMDRLTLNLQSKDLMREFGFQEDGYGHLEAAFGSAFAIGAILMGWLADRVNIRLLYPLAVICWSIAGLATGLVHTFAMLLICRFALGFAEAGNWPCALRTTQHILPPHQRTLGNSILQSGAAIGAVLTPVLVYYLYQWTGGWRWSFIVVGLLGGLWAGVWLLSVRSRDLEIPPQTRGTSLMAVMGWLLTLLALDTLIHLVHAGMVLPGDETTWVREIPHLPLYSKALSTVIGILIVGRWMFHASQQDDLIPRPLFIRRYIALGVTVVAINITWHFLRAWLPLLLQDQHNYTRDQTTWFTLYYYLSTDVGSLAAGFLVLIFARTFLGVHGSRLLVYFLFSLLALLSVPCTWLKPGEGLETAMLLIGFGSLGLFPIYYSLSQDLTRQHQGKVTGSLGCICWLAMSLLQESVGASVKETGSYAMGLMLAGLAPLVGLLALLLLWGPWVSPGAETPGQGHPRTPDPLAESPGSPTGPGTTGFQMDRAR
jgi:ACS family hexuronate transporter-like MFS transporter